MESPMKQWSGLNLNDVYEQLYALAQKKDIVAFDILAKRFINDFISNSSSVNQADLRRTQEDIERELSQCKTMEERMTVISNRFKALYRYVQDIRNGTAPVCVKFPNISFVT